MAQTQPATQPIELDSADETIALQMTRWLTHLRAERRLSPKTLEAYARDLRQCLDFLCEHWGTRVTLARFSLLEAADSTARAKLLIAFLEMNAFGQSSENPPGRTN